MVPNKKLGQNFLNNKDILSNIVSEGNISKDDTVLEIGPGTGNLTKIILKKNPKKLIVVEKDKRLSDYLNNRFGEKIIVVNEDILKYLKNTKFEIPVKVFGNLPYNISTEILISFLKNKELEKISHLIFIFQKEVADRILAMENSKKYGRLSILTSWKMNRAKLFDINPKDFYPIPKVWSTLIKLWPKKDSQKINKIKNLEHVTNIFFNQRRKMIGKPMKQLFKNYDQVAKNLNLDLNLRPQNLTKDKYIEICKYYEINLTNS